MYRHYYMGREKLARMIRNKNMVSPGENLAESLEKLKGLQDVFVATKEFLLKQI